MNEYQKRVINERIVIISYTLLMTVTGLSSLTMPTTCVAITEYDVGYALIGYAIAYGIFVGVPLWLVYNRHMMMRVEVKRKNYDG